ncbi:response regulator [Sphingopyxis sp.]|uniref:response regulator n=1 Tax=Sphingopyxis sp. TaxID=1908224 RepID=UPI001DE6CC72|nr:response regulator [Sphingopyxis sp.]MBW8296388.1 response regulator [Sphingopyxis sp.]
MSERTILLVEDEFLIRMMLSESLREEGYTVLEASDGEEGLAVLQSGQQVDLMITDVRMPGGIDGMELTRRSNALAPSRPVIVCSGHLVSSEAALADVFLAKPFPAETLVRAVTKLMGTTWKTDSQTRSA